ncbi:MAG: DnaJ domain-containing protein [Chloroflexi bacterium]|nr:DnaJ domain-containing protein [Chloroflexota bacterium]
MWGNKVAKDYYAILGVPKGCSGDEIKKAYRKMAMQYHPDRNPGKEKWAHDKFKEINEAFGVLGDPGKRQRYDRLGTAGAAGDVFASRHTRAGFDDLARDFGGAGLGLDFLDEIFGDILKGRDVSFAFRSYGGPGGVFTSSPGRAGGFTDFFRHSRGNGAGRDARYELDISRAEAVQGTRKILARGGKRLEVRVPPGVDTGATIRLSNARRITDGQPGDILIQIRVR